MLYACCDLPSQQSRGRERPSQKVDQRNRSCSWSLLDAGCFLVTTKNLHTADFQDTIVLSENFQRSPLWMKLGSWPCLQGERSSQNSPPAFQDVTPCLDHMHPLTERHTRLSCHQQKPCEAPGGGFSQPHLWVIGPLLRSDAARCHCHYRKPCVQVKALYWPDRLAVLREELPVSWLAHITQQARGLFFFNV